MYGETFEALMYSDYINNRWYKYPSKHTASLTYPTLKQKWVKMEIFVATSTHSVIYKFLPHQIYSW